MQVDLITFTWTENKGYNYFAALHEPCLEQVEAQWRINDEDH